MLSSSRRWIFFSTLGWALHYNRPMHLVRLRDSPEREIQHCLRLRIKEQSAPSSCRFQIAMLVQILTHLRVHAGIAGLPGIKAVHIIQ